MGRRHTAVIPGDRVAGCDVCHGRGAVHWRGPNAQAVAARHHDATGHSTWAESTMTVIYGDRSGASAPGQDSLFVVETTVDLAGSVL